MKAVHSYALRAAMTLSVALAITPLATARAGLIVVSGDVNIADWLNGIDAVAGNQTFFKNVLQGGTRVFILSTFNAGGFVVGKISDFYNFTPGVTADSDHVAITPEILAGVDLFISVTTDHAFTTDETTVLRDFVAGGGTVFFLGDNSLLGIPNGYINDALAAMGSGLSIVPDIIGSGYSDATGNQIAADPLTAGISSFRYQVTSRVAGGTNLFFVTQPQPFIAYEATASFPRLTIRKIQTSDVQISWRTNAAGFSLEFATNLPPVAWLPLTNIAILNGNFVVTQDMSFPEQFFRLHKP